MSFGPLDSLAVLRDYLAAEILPDVAGAQQGELRAAIKVLEELGEEFDRAPVVLHEETTTLHRLCTQAQAILDPVTGTANLIARVEQLGRGLGPVSLTLKDAQALNDNAATCMSECIAALQRIQHDAVHGEPARACLHDCYAELSRQAARRAQWQSVFSR